MAAFGLGKLPFFSPRNRDDDDDAKFEDAALGAAEHAHPAAPERQVAGQAQPCRAAPPKIGRRENQIDGQAMRRPLPEAAVLEGGFLALAGIRDHYMAKEPDKGCFVIRHIESGKEISIAGIDYIQFADLTVSCAFLTRSNPESLVLPAPASAPRQQGNIHELAKDVAAAVDEGLLAPHSAEFEASVPEALETKDGPIELGTAIEEALGADSEKGQGAKQSNSDDTAGATKTTGPDSSLPTAITITEAELLAGAGDDAAASLRITDITCGQNGKLENNGDGSWIFQPEAGFDGEIALQLTVVDETEEEASVEAIITIEAGEEDESQVSPSDAPEAMTAPEKPASLDEAMPAAQEAGEPSTGIARDEISGGDEPALEAKTDGVTASADITAATPETTSEESEPESLTVKVSELIGDDFEGQNVRLHGFTQPSNGRLVDNGDGTLSFTPDPDWDGSTTFEYTVIDEEGHTTVGTLIVELDPGDELPSEAPSDPAGTTPVEHTDLYAGARYEDVEVDEEDRLIGESAPTYADAWAGSLGAGEIGAGEIATDEIATGEIGRQGTVAERPLETAAETPPKKRKKRSSNAKAAEELFKKLDW